MLVPEDKTKMTEGAFDTRVKQKMGKGAAVVTDFVDGPNMKGKVQQEIQTQSRRVGWASARDRSAQRPAIAQRLSRAQTQKWA